MQELPRREQQVLDALFELGEAGAEQIRSAMPDPPSNSAVRAMLVRIEAKGFIRHRIENQRYLYSPAGSRQVARQHALRRLIRLFFEGSPASAATALLGMAEPMQEDELKRLEDLVKAARRRAK